MEEAAPGRSLPLGDPVAGRPADEVMAGTSTARTHRCRGRPDVPPAAAEAPRTLTVTGSQQRFAPVRGTGEPRCPGPLLPRLAARNTALCVPGTVPDHRADTPISARNDHF
ncbi:hypothetical protein GCM10010358_13350 [Streptomyces minutiscleroticus]|uniref:Uncharacterized protein n=1 Tax=Streptomyces minutiscleroticus TaxID=68238 RepID=A0A918NDX6_9ACTN|nr:hypothetical protein GCM10010358_13350 [Streptomyces minutiscleroticus]